MRFCLKNAKQIKRRGGDTIIEVVVSAIILLLAMAVLQGAVTFCQKALSKNSRMRANYSAMMQALPAAESKNDDNKTADYVFHAVDVNGVRGSEVFHLKVGLGTKTVSFEDTKNNSTKTVTFDVFMAAGSGSGD